MELTAQYVSTGLDACHKRIAELENLLSRAWGCVEDDELAAEIARALAS